MDFQPMNTADESTSHRKVLLYAAAGFGKTTQFRYYQEHFGPGLILSGESGLSSIRTAGIDYLPFTSWEGVTDPDRGLYSFVDIFKFTRSDAFRARGYKWIGIDSLTELSDLSMKAANAEAEAKAARDNKKVSGFDVWANHGAQLIGACKAIRDLPMHVLVTALARESSDENGRVSVLPMVAGKQTMQQLPGIFDCVFGGIRTSTGDPTTGQQVVRYLITDEVRGWQCKVRDEKRRLRPVERTANVVDLLKRLDMDDADYAAWKATQAPTAPSETDN
jgi:hypothetical protein